MSDPTKVVAAGYDRCAQRWDGWLEPSSMRAKYLRLGTDGLPPGARVVDLGCGTGRPVLDTLARRTWAAGVDVSLGMLQIARTVGAPLVRGDMADVAFAPACLDAVVGFYSIIHVPRERHGPLLHEIARWLRPGGTFVANMGAADTPAGYRDDWLGQLMFWSQYDAETNRRLVEEAGLTIVRGEVAVENAERFWWVLARKPR